MLSLLAAALCAALAQGATVSYSFRVKDTYTNFFRPTIDLDPPAQRMSLHELYITGAYRNTQLINDQYPGPLIEANYGDTIEVEVENALRHGTVSIHWHGVHQRRTPHCDGVYSITECGILPFHNKTYEFLALPYGTRWWHSHMGNQYETGIAGPLIIYNPDDPHADLYDEEQVVSVTDWWRMPDTLVDSMGTFDSADDSYDMDLMTTLLNGQWGNGTAEYPWPLIEVEQGKCYRLRIICMASQMPGYRVSFWGHSMRAIAIDGNDIEPKETADVAIYGGDRVDVVLCADQAVDNYQIMLREHQNHQDTLGTYPAYAYLHYKGAPIPDANSPGGPAGVPRVPKDAYYFDLMKAPSDVKMYSPEKVPDYTPGYRFTMDLGSLKSSDELTHAFWYGFTQHTPWSWPQTPLLHLQPGESCGKRESDTTLTINDLGTVIEVIFNNLVDVPHPMHIHGHDMFVLGTGYEYGGWNDAGSMPSFTECETVAKWADPRWDGFKYERYWGCVYTDEHDFESLNLDDPIRKDSITVPARTWGVVRVEANNAGIWAWHCHTIIHDMLGMMMVLDVAPGHPDRLRPAHEPVCGSCAGRWLANAENAVAALQDENADLAEQLAAAKRALASGSKTASASPEAAVDAAAAADVEADSQSGDGSSYSLAAVLLLPTGVVLLVAAVVAMRNRRTDDFEPVQVW